MLYIVLVIEDSHRHMYAKYIFIYTYFLQTLGIYRTRDTHYRQHHLLSELSERRERGAGEMGQQFGALATLWGTGV